MYYPAINPVYIRGAKMDKFEEILNQKTQNKISIEQINSFVSEAYSLSFEYSALEQLRIKITLEETARLWLKMNGYQFDHHAWVRYWKAPGSIEHMAKNGHVRLYQASSSSFQTYHDSEVWRKVEFSDVEENLCNDASFEGEDLPFEL